MNNGNIIIFNHTPNIAFANVNHRSDLIHISAVEICNRRETMYSALVHKAKEECFKHIIIMMTECNFIAAVFDCHII